MISASTKSNDPVHQAASMCRKRGRIVLVGITGLELKRADFYEKELSIQVSCSYGPGRYDPSYEEKGQDYPLGFVRWTEQRNFEAILQLISAGQLDVKLLISHRFNFEDALKAYKVVVSGNALGIVLKYKNDDLNKEKSSLRLNSTIDLNSKPKKPNSTDPVSLVIGLIGAGNFCRQILLPKLAQTNVSLKTIVSEKGLSGTHMGNKYNFEHSSTDTDYIINDPEINMVFITTRHDSHADYVVRSLKANKNVYVEKPLCLNSSELEKIKAVLDEINQVTHPILMVGFNRRFAPHIIKIRSLLNAVREPKSFIYTINAGAIPNDHWTQTKDKGGGRIIGETCHFIDLLRFLAGHSIVKSYAMFNNGSVGTLDDTASINLSFADGSIGTIHYFANGNRSFPKERLEVFCSGRVLQLDNFRKLRGYGWPNFKKMNLFRQDKGHAAELKVFVQSIIKGNRSPIPFEEIEEVTRVSFDIAERIGF